MAEFWAQVMPDGRLVVPAEIRKRLGLKPGGEVKVTKTFEEALRPAQDTVAQYVEPGTSLVDELIADRGAEAQRE